MKKVFLVWIALVGLMCHQLLAQCDTVRVFPWDNDFYTAFGCWEQLGDSSSLWQLNADNSFNFANAAYINAPNDSAANGCVLVSPALALPADTANMRLSFKTRLVGTSVQLRVLVSTSSRDNLAGYDTLLSVTPSGINSYEVNLSAYAGQTVYVAFSLVKPNQSYNVTFFGVGSVNIISDHMPQGEWLIQNMAAHTGDTVEHEFYLTQGIEMDSNTAFVWNSTMVTAGQATLVEVVTDLLLDYATGRTLPRSIYRVIYHAPGIDTVSVTASNIYGTISSQSVSNVYDCAPITAFPWAMDLGDLGVCWSTDYSIHNNATYGFNDEDDALFSTDCCLQSPSYSENFVVTNAIAVPADATHLALTLRWRIGVVEVRAAHVSQDDNLWDYLPVDTTLFTDLLFNEAGSSFLKTRKVDLAAYVGDTIRLAVIHKSSNVLYLMPLDIDYDTLPKIASVQLPSLVTVDSATLCTASLRYGATDGLHYNWSSARGGVFVTNAMGDSAWVTYPGGVGDMDTIRVVATNAYGSDTVMRTLNILDCTPQLVLPWRETFSYGLDCWYQPEGSNYNIWNNNCLHSLCNSNTIDSWIMSKAITIPADTNQEVVLEWKTASSYSDFVHTYYVLATSNANYTDTANYIPLYYDSSTHPNYATFDKHSVSLRQFAGQTIHLAFRNRPVNATGNNYRLFIDDVVIRSAQLPVVRVSGPSTVNSHEEVTYTATYLEGSTNGLTLTWHSTLLDSTWTAPLPSATSWTLVYPMGGYDTVTLIATNAYGSDTTTRGVMVYGCLIATLPYEEDFNGVVATTYNASSGGNVPACWHRYWNGSSNYTPRVISNYPDNPIHNYVSNSNKALMMMAAFDTGFDTVAIVESPLFDAPLNEQLLSFYYMQESTNRGVLSVGYLQNGAFVEVISLEPQTTGRTDTVSLSDFPSNIHRFALQWKQDNTIWYGVIVDNIRLFAPDSMPSVRLTVPQNTTFVGDTTTYNAHLTNGMANGLTYTWHSTLLGTTVVGGSQWSVVYPISGFDTITVIATNAYGSDTAWGIHHVDAYPLPQVTLTGPSSMTLQSSTVSRTATFISTLNDCSPHGLTYTWHSTLLNQWSTASGRWSVVYTTGGIDTITLVVSNVDGADTASMIVTVYDCGGVAVPYFEDFENVTAEDWNSAYGNLPDCWGTIAIGASHRPKVVSSYQYISNLPDQALLIMAGIYSGYATEAFALLPVFSDSLQNLSVAFDYRCESADYGALTVGYWNDSLLTFHSVRSLGSHVNSYTRDTVSFASVTTSDNHTHIALKWYCNSSFYGVAIDNIQVFRDSSDYATSGLAVDSVSAHCVTLSWHPFTGATAYHVTVGAAIDTTVSGTTVTLCGLDEATPYVAGVAPVVAGVIGYHTTVAFTTRPFCSSLSGITYAETGGNLVLNCQFDGRGETTPSAVTIAVTDLTTGAQWQTVGTGSGDLLTGFSAGHDYRIVVTALCGGTAMGESDTLVFTMPASVCYEVRGTHSESFHFIDGYSEYNYNQMLYPATAVGSIDTLYGIAFRVTEQNSYCYRTVDIYVGHSTATTLTSPVSATNLTQVADDYRFEIADTGWSRIIFDTPFAYDGTSNLIVTLVDNSNFQAPFSPGTGMHAPQAGEAFLTYSKNFYSDPVPDPYTLNFTTYAFSWIPDIQLLGGCNFNQCLGPWVSVDNTTTHSISLSWTQRGTESLWQVEYRTESDAPWTVATVTAVTAYTMTGLTPATTYQFRLASLCSGDVVYGDSLTACTVCDTVQLPYHTDFTIGHYPCWIAEGYTWESFSGIRLIATNNSLDYKVISPAVGSALSSVKVTVRALNPYDDSHSSNNDAAYKVGICDADGSNAVWIDTVPIVQRHVLEEHTVYLNHYSGTQHHVIVRPVYNTTELHSVTLDLINGCIPVHEVWVSHLTDTSATVEWEPENNSNAHAVYFEGLLLGIAPAGVTVWPLPTLAPGTEYTVAVREICSPGDTSVAISHTFRTACAALSLPYFEDFGNSAYQEANVGVPDCWTLHSNPSVDYSIAYYDPELHLYSSPYADNNISNYVLSPLLNVGPHGGTVSFKARAGFAGIVGAVEVGVMTNVSDTASFIPCLTVDYLSGTTALQWYQFSTDSLTLPDVWAVAIRWGRGHQCAFDSLTVTANPDPFVGIDTPQRSPLTPQFSLYPNPASKTVTLMLDEALKINNEECLEVLDVQGRCVLTQAITHSRNHAILLDISPLPAGIYYVRLAGTVEKLIICD